MRAHSCLVFLLAPLLALTSCVTNTATQRSPSSKLGKAHNSKAKEKPLAKEGQKALQGSDPNSLTPPAPAPQRTAQNLADTFDRLNDPTMQLKDEDIHTATALHPATKGSVEEGIVILAQLRSLNMQVDQSSKFQSHDLYENGVNKDHKPIPKPSVEKVFQGLNIDLLSSIQLNSKLKTPPTFVLLKTLLDNSENSATFTGSIQKWIDEESQKLAINSGAPNIDGAPAPATPAVITPAQNPEINAIGSSEVHTAATDLKHSDSILMQAQKLADKGEFRLAIDQAGRIENRDPFFDQAKEKIKVFSNRAVQDLRQKAALAFQNAMPVADSKAKSAYLQQAKDLLELALKEFPSADQLDTVRENLAVITRDLSGVEQDSARDSTSKPQ